MKSKILLSFLVSWFSFFAYIPSVHGEPADMFKPIVDEIQEQLPSGLSMRLPSYIPASDVPMYPFVTTDETGLKVNIGIKPDCASSKNPNSCIIGAIAAVPPKAVKSWPPQGDNRQRVNLDNGIRGFFFTRGKGDAKVSFVAWEQDKQKFGIVALSAVASQKELLDIAKSMTGEKPITSN